MRTPKPDPATTGHSAKTARSLTGIVLACARLTRGAGRGASSGRRSRRLLLLAAAILAILVAVAVPALAAEPTLTVDPVSSHTITTAGASGTITTDSEADGGAETFWFFQYSEAGKGEWANGPQAFTRTVPAETSAQPVEEELTGLKASTSYEVRLAAFPVSGGETFSAPSASFTTSPAPNAPTLVLDPVAGLTATSATISGSVDPEGGNLDGPGEPVPIAWFLETNREGQGFSPVASGTIEGEPAEKSEVIPVEAPLSELPPGNHYAFRLRAFYAGQEVTSSEGAFTTPAVAPTVTTGAVAHVSLTEATLDGEINPGGAETHFFFEYGTSQSYERSTPVQTISEELNTLHPTEAQPIEAHLSGLEPFTEYHYRIVASNPGHEVKGSDATFRTFAGPPASGGCPNEAFRTGASAALPDCRAYELVTEDVPGDPEVYVPFGNPGEVALENGVPTKLAMQASGDGDALVYQGDPGSVGGEGENGRGLGDAHLATRLPGGGWQTEDIEPPVRRSVIYQGFTPDLRIGIFSSGFANEPDPPQLSATAPGDGNNVLYAQSEGPAAPSGEARYSPLLREPLDLGRPPTQTEPTKRNGVEPFGTGEPVLTVKSASGWLAFAGGSAGYRDTLFEANDDILAGSAPYAAELGADVQAEITHGEEHNYLFDSVEGVLSLVDVSPAGAVVPGATFGARSFEPGSSQPDFDHVISADGDRVYWTATADEQVYLRENPTADEECAAPGEAGKACTIPVSSGPARYWTASADGRYAFYTEEGQLFRFDAREESRTELTQQSGAEVQGVIGISEDGGKVYFVAAADLTGEEEDAEGQKAQAGQDNLYLDEGGTTTFVTTLAAGDGSEVAPIFSGGGGFQEIGDWEPSQARRTARVTGGGALVFMSSASLPSLGHRGGYPNRGTEEVYVYEAASGELLCASCSPTGEPPTGQSFLPISFSATYQPRWISEDGDRVVFESQSSLVAADRNENLDVYEWEREGSEGCPASQATDGGCLHILSGGTNPDGSWLLGEDEEGANVFIATRAQFSPQDGDEEMDVYDARIDAEPAHAEVVCEGREECSHSEPAVPGYSSPPTSSFRGAANPTQKQCKKGQVRKHGKCVKKQEKSKKNKHHKKKNGKKQPKHKRASSEHGGRK